MADINEFWKIKFPPPLWYAFLIVDGVILQLFVEFSMGLSTAVRIIVPVVFLLLFMALGTRAIRLFRSSGEDEKPWTPANQLLTDGPYKLTRNPMYVGLACLQAAFGFGLDNAWILVFIPVALILVYLTAIRFEEAYLEAEFGQTYLDYKAKVRRFL